MRRVKVLIYGYVLSPRVQNIISTLSNNGYLVEAIRWNPLGRTKDVKSVNGVEIIDIGLKAPLGGLKLMFYLPLLYFRILKLMKGQSFEILHITHIILLPLALFIKIWKKVKVVYDDYDFYSIKCFASLTGVFKPLKPLIKYAQRVMIALVDLVLVIDSANDFLLKEHRKINKNVVPILNVPPLLPPSSTSVLLDLKRSLKGKNQNAKIVIYVGILHRRNGLLQTLEAMKIVWQDMKNVLLVLVGVIAPSFREDLARFMDSEEVQERIKLIARWIPYKELAKYLEISDIGLALYEPTPLHLLCRGNASKIYDYMSCGLSVIAPNFSEIGKVVKEKKCGILVDVTNIQEIASAILHLLKNPQEAKKMGERGKKAFIEQYNWHIEEEKLLHAYKVISMEELS